MPRVLCFDVTCFLSFLSEVKKKLVVLTMYLELEGLCEVDKKDGKRGTRSTSAKGVKK